MVLPNMIVVALWLAGCNNPSPSAESGTCSPTLQMLHFWPCFVPLRPPLDGLSGNPDSLDPADPCTDSTCTWCHSYVTDLEVP
jgi:hypothetical protein